jgi:hypothetical protein
MPTRATVAKALGKRGFSVTGEPPKGLNAAEKKKWMADYYKSDEYKQWQAANANN